VENKQVGRTIGALYWSLVPWDRVQRGMGSTSLITWRVVSGWRDYPIVSDLT